MSFIAFLLEDPLLVWVVLVFFVDIGLKSLHKHTVYIPRLFLFPVIVFILKSQDFTTTPFITMFSVLFLSLGATVGVVVGYNSVVTFDKKTCTVDLPGSPVTFGFLVAFFGIKFIIEYFKQHHLNFILTYVVIDTVVSALFAGYFLGRASYFAYACFRRK